MAAAPDSPTYATRLLAPDTWDDFAALVEANDGVWGGCWCIGFHPEGLGGTAEDHRTAKRAHTDNGTVHQVLVYDGDTCVGWCQFGPTDELPRIKHKRAYLEGLDKLPDWRITCFFSDSKHRRSGMAAAALGGALAGLAGPPSVGPDRCRGDSTRPMRGA